LEHPYSVSLVFHFPFSLIFQHLFTIEGWITDFNFFYCRALHQNDLDVYFFWSNWYIWFRGYNPFVCLSTIWTSTSRMIWLRTWTDRKIELSRFSLLWQSLGSWEQCRIPCI
jgi:hypothetical protein